MLPFRVTLRGTSSIRAFSTSRVLRNDLSYQVFGPEKDETSQSPIVFLHGLFGSKQNNRSISKALARDLKREVFILDLRNHGQSFHSKEHTYSAMAEDVVNFIHQQKLNKCVLIGHSMGAKTAMTVALDSPNLISALIPVDNAPVNAPLKSDFGKYVRGMQQIEAQNVAKQSDADKILKDYEEVSSPVHNAGVVLTAVFHKFQSLPIRQFLLTNLVRGDHGAMKFRVPVSILGDALSEMANFPYAESSSATYDGPTLFVRGTKSRYVSDDTIPAIKKFFPKAQIADVEAGHWLISENPEAFRQKVVTFLQETP
ncbi:alpha/beta fold family hydrolase [Aspergillus flavus]|uniref:Alpha/beta fold family hydrolase n=2 Tax=Aspergillus flavus TaxID=5059 RepID=A0A7U2MQA9_ASPFN|nr:alpha/beta fold family hydrolase [Aspergillus flavus]RAQ71334.1 alpha/beta fold family hydrolase [Aspergillus flavus]RAQ81217.1 alpha/beta fold family hydrolase [Aspergillus flavus]RMZ45560.1 alpha/beta fold family hydrolase [Aspergillus flavus]